MKAKGMKYKKLKKEKEFCQKRKERKSNWLLINWYQWISNNNSNNNQSKIHSQKLNGEFPDLDSKIHLTFRVDNGSHRRFLTGGNRPSDSFTRHSNPNLLTLQPLHLHLHLRIHLNHHWKTFLLLQTRSQASQRLCIQILRTWQHRPETRLVILIGVKRRQRTVSNEDRIREGTDGERFVEEDKVIVRVFSDESEIEESSEVRRWIRWSCEVHLRNAEICDREFRPVRTVQYVKCSTDNGSEKCDGEGGENCPETAATAEITVRSMATVVLRLRTVNLTVRIVKLRFHGTWISVSGYGAVNCAVTVGFGGWFCHCEIEWDRSVKWRYERNERKGVEMWRSFVEWSEGKR